MSHDRVFGCICHDEGDEQIVAVLALNHVLASKILALQAAFLADKARGTGIVEVTFEAHNVRFFHERLSVGPGVEDFRAAVGDRLDAEPDNVADWVDLGGIAVPAGGDYVTTYEHLHIATTYIFIEAIGKHAEAPFTTAALPCELLRAVVAEGAPSEVTGNHAPAAPPTERTPMPIFRVRLLSPANIVLNEDDAQGPADVRDAVEDFLATDLDKGDCIEITCLDPTGDDEDDD